MDDPLEQLTRTHRPATSAEIRNWSRGSIKRRLSVHEQPDDWRATAGTVWDPRIFGFTKDWACACGRFDGAMYARTICPVCGVRVMLSKARQIRFAHLNLAEAIPHPLVSDAEPLDALPIAPIVFRNDAFGRPLAAAYDELVHRNLARQDADAVAEAYRSVIEALQSRYLEQVVDHSQAAENLAKSMALLPADDAADEEDVPSDSFG